MAAAMEELTVSIDQINEHAKGAYRISQISSAQAIEGGRVIQSTATEMENISSTNHFELGMYRKGQVRKVVFDKPGTV